MCLAAGVGGAGSAGAARHHSCCKNSSIVYRCLGSTQRRWVIRSFAVGGQRRKRGSLKRGIPDAEVLSHQGLKKV